MGLFVTEEGRYQGWLAAFLCCCAAVNDDENLAGNSKPKTPIRQEMCYEYAQSSTLSTSSIMPLNNAEGGPPGSKAVNHNSTVLNQPPSLRPLSLGEPSLLSSRPAKGVSTSRTQKPSIGAPYAFRRVDLDDQQRQHLVPLRLGPVVLRDAPVTSYEGPTPLGPLQSLNDAISGSVEDSPANDTRPNSYRDNRESPFQRFLQQTAIERQRQSTDPTAKHGTGLSQQATSSMHRPTLSSKSSSSVPSQELEPSQTEHDAKISICRARPKRKRSFPMLRNHDEEKLEQEIKELNDIVEERRSGHARGYINGQHTPAVAPAMQVRARSETLNSIGSALSRPLAEPGLPDPATGMPIDPTSTKHRAQRSKSSESWTNTRLSGWLSDIMPSSAQGPSTTKEPFYKCNPPPHDRRPHTGGSRSTLWSQTNSPSLTVASTPPGSRGQAHDLIGPAWREPLLPSTPPDDSHGRMSDEEKLVQHWPFITMPTNDVGMAL